MLPGKLAHSNRLGRSLRTEDRRGPTVEERGLDNGARGETAGSNGVCTNERSEGGRGRGLLGQAYACAGVSGVGLPVHGRQASQRPETQEKCGNSARPCVGEAKQVVSASGQTDDSRWPQTQSHRSKAAKVEAPRTEMRGTHCGSGLVRGNAGAWRQQAQRKK